MRRSGIVLVAFSCLAVLLIAAPVFAQAPQPAGQTIVTKRAPQAKESRRLVTWDNVAGNWKRFKGKIRKQWGRLTHNDVAVAQGKREELVGKIQSRYGIDKDQADKQVEAWLKQQK